jgi:hypothetical protein
MVMIHRRFPDLRRAFKPATRSLVFFGVVAIGTSWAADGGVTRFWNLTGETIVHLTMAPAGTTAWGPDQCRNDPDGSVDFDERLRLTGVSSGHYDIRFTDRSGRTCTVTDVDVKAGAVFAIGKEALAACHGP